MNSIVECFGNIVGTTQDEPTDSGLYITDLEAVDTIEGLIAGENDVDVEIEEKLLKARRVAILKLHTDLTTLMLQYAVPKSGFTGQIGSKKALGVLNEVGKSGIRVVCSPVQDAELVLYGVNTIFNQTGQIDIKIASNINDDIHEYTIDAQEDRLKVNTFAEPLVLPLVNPNEDGYVEYYIYHENSINPINNKIKCSTCSKFYFNAENPFFKLHGYEQYVNVAGFNGEIDELDKKGVNSGKGLQLNVELRCRTDRALCNGGIDFLTNPIAMSMATAIQYKAGSAVVWDLIRTPGLNRILMGDMESFREAATYYDRKYNDMVRYISQTMPITSDCYCLKQKARKQTMYA